MHTHEPGQVITYEQLTVEKRKQMVDRTLESAFIAVDEYTVSMLEESTLCSNSWLLS